MRAVSVFSASDTPSVASEAVVPFIVCGADSHYLAFEMDTGDTVYAERGAFVTGGGAVHLSAAMMTAPARSTVQSVLAPLRLIRQLFGRVATGESAWSLTVHATGRADCLIGNPKGGQIGRIALVPGADEVTLLRGAWIAHTGRVQLALAAAPVWWSPFLTRTRFFWQRVWGEGDVFFAAHGQVIERVLQPGEARFVDPHALLGWAGPLTWTPEYTGFKASLFSGEGYTLIRVVGPGRLFVDAAASAAHKATNTAVRPEHRKRHHRGGDAEGGRRVE